MLERLHIIGRKDHGKTTLVVELVQLLTTRGLKVGTIKHTHHRHELDVPGKDSHRHRIAGASAVGILSKGLSAVFLPVADSEANGDPYTALAPSFVGCDLVIVEGDSMTTAPKIEVWRAEVGNPPIAQEDRDVLAVVTDDELPISTPTLPRRDGQAIADWVVGRFLPPSSINHAGAVRSRLRDGGS